MIKRHFALSLRFLYRAWKERSARYVLLVGDASTFPVRYFAFDRVTPAAHDMAFDPSDLYYADVAKADGRFDDWQADKDGHHALYFGEIHGEKIKKGPINFDQINYRPKLAVGRWPANSPEHVKLLVDKSIAFENQLIVGKKSSPRMGTVVVAGWVDARDQALLHGTWRHAIGPAPDRSRSRQAAQLGGRSYDPHRPWLERNLGRLHLDGKR